MGKERRLRDQAAAGHVGASNEAAEVGARGNPAIERSIPTAGVPPVRAHGMMTGSKMPWAHGSEAKSKRNRSEIEAESKRKSKISCG